MNRLNDNGCSARVNFDGGDGTPAGRNAGIKDVIGFHADHLPENMIR